MHKPYTARAVAAAAFMLLAPAAMAQTTLAPRDGTREDHSRSERRQPATAGGYRQAADRGWNTPPTTPQGWQQLSDTAGRRRGRTGRPMAQRLHVKIKPGTIDGVKVYYLTPETHPGPQRKAPAHPCPWRLLCAERR